MQLNYKQIGQGPDVVLIHGLFGSLENLNVIAKPLSEHFCVTNVDLRNHGLSPHSDEMDYTAMANDVVELMTALNIQKAHLVGHSMGGKVAMQIALSHTDLVDKLVVLDIAPVSYPARHTQILEALNAVKNVTTTHYTGSHGRLSALRSPAYKSALHKKCGSPHAAARH